MEIPLPPAPSPGVVQTTASTKPSLHIPTQMKRKASRELAKDTSKNSAKAANRSQKVIKCSKADRSREQLEPRPAERQKSNGDIASLPAASELSTAADELRKLSNDMTKIGKIVRDTNCTVETVHHQFDDIETNLQRAVEDLDDTATTNQELISDKLDQLAKALNTRLSTFENFMVISVDKIRAQLQRLEDKPPVQVHNLFTVPNNDTTHFVR